MADQTDTMERAVVARADALAQGLKRYFTGIPCKRGHVCERRVDGHQCLECYVVAHRKGNLAYAKRHKDKVAAAGRKWRANNPEKRAAVLARYNAKPEAKEVNRLASERVRKRNPGRVTEWKRANPEAVKALHAKRRAQKRQAGGHHTRDQLAAMLVAQKRRCIDCGKSLRKGYHADHIQPLSRGGSNDISNIQLLCPACNLSKNAKDPFEWARLRGRLL